MKIEINAGSLMGVVVGLIGTGFAIGSTLKMRKLARKLDRTVDQVIDSSEIELSETVVNKAVAKAADKAASKAVTSATKEAIGAIKADIGKQVSDEVYKSYSDVSAAVKTRVATEVAKIDRDRLSNEIRKEAKEAVLTKFNNDLDDILEKYNTDLSNISKIYQSISSSIAANSSPGMARTALL